MIFAFISGSCYKMVKMINTTSLIRPPAKHRHVSRMEQIRNKDAFNIHNNKLLFYSF